jgi:hypothetical protein
MVQSLSKARALSDLEHQIAAEIRGTSAEMQKNPHPTNATPQEVDAPALAMPDYLEHREGTTEIGRLSAEGIVREYEAAAKEIETVGAELVERVKQCETVTRDALAVTTELKEIAARYREEAKRVFLEIEGCSLVTAEVRNTCAELKEKIAGSGLTDRPKPKKR